MAIPDTIDRFAPSPYPRRAREGSILFGCALLLSALSVGTSPVRGQEEGRGFPNPTVGPWPGGFAATSEATSTTEGALTLLLPFGARGIAMGRAMTAVPGPESVFWNPAGLGQLEGGHITVLRGETLAGEATSASLLLTRQPLGAVALTYQFLDAGGGSARDDQGNFVGNLSYTKHLAIVSFGTHLLRGLDAGLNFKVFQDRESCRGLCPDGSGQVGTTYMVDAGLQAVPFPDLPLRLGVMVAHLGPRLQIINVEQSDPLPTRIRVGAGYEVLRHFLHDEGMELWVVGEMEDRWRSPGSPVLYLGSEFLAGEGDVFFLRTGYGRGSLGAASGASVGLGMRYDRFDLSIAKALTGVALDGSSEPAHVSFGVVF